MRPPGTTDAAELNDKADARLAAALANNQRGDNSTILTVLFALVLFFVAMSQRDIALWVRRTPLGIGAVLAVAGIALLLTCPVRI